MTTLKADEFRQIIDSLSVFVSSRASSIHPSSKIGVSASAGKLKLISGSYEAGMSVLIGPHDGKFGYTVDPEPLQKIAQLSKGMDWFDVEATEDALTIESDSGGKITLAKQGDLADSNFPKNLG